MNIVDSCGWLEYISGNRRGEVFAKYIENTNTLIVPVIIIYEVFKKILNNNGEENALKVIAHMKLAKVIDLNTELSLMAAKISKEKKLPMADAIIYATAKKYQCTIWTQDEHFMGLENIEFIKKI